jgi:hypothetical protein
VGKKTMAVLVDVGEGINATLVAVGDGLKGVRVGRGAGLEKGVLEAATAGRVGDCAPGVRYVLSQSGGVRIEGSSGA